MREAPAYGRTRPLEYLVAALAYAAVACVSLFPVFTRGAGEIYSPNLHLTRPMARWVMWILSWDVHALTSSASLFDANIFFPAPNSLTFGDPLLGLVPFFAPFYLLTGDSVVAYQATLLITLASCGASMFYLARHWGVGLWPAVLAGFLYAFCPARIGLLAELAHIGGQFLPLALVYADRFAADRKWSHGILLFVFAAWQLQCGTQLAYASLGVLSVYVVVGALVPGRGSDRLGSGLALAMVGAAAGVFWLSLAPYRSLLAEGLYDGKTMRDLASFASADAWRMYLVPPYLARSAADGDLYVGVLALLLAAAGIAWAVARERRLAAQLIAVAAVSYWMSLGLGVGGGDLALYSFALERIPGFAMLGPAPSRFVMFLMVPVAAFAAFGLDLVRSLDRRAIGTAVGLVVCAAALADYRLPLHRLDTQRVVVDKAEMPLYGTLADLPPGPVLELPMQPCAVGAFSAAIDRQLASTLHWKPLLDGYKSQYRAPPTHDVVRAMSNSLPDPRVLELVRRATGLRYVVVHLTELPGDWRRRWRSVEGMTRLGFFGNDLLFELGAGGDADLVDTLLGLPKSDRTLTGVAAEALPETERLAGLEYSKLPPRAARAGQRVRAEILVENRSKVAWPALTPHPEERVYVSYLWADADGELAGGDARAQALPLDLAPGESVVVPVCARVPRKMGELKLSFGVTQAEQWFPEYTERIGVSIIP